MPVPVRAVRFSLPADLAYLDVARRFLAVLGDKSGLSEREVHEIQLVVTEAMTNVIEHGYGPTFEGGIVDLEFEVSDEVLVLVLRDRAPVGFDGAGPEVDLERYRAERKVGGLGLQLMRRLFDEVAFAREEPDGANLVRLVRRVRRGE
ncbi:MAG: ATP-binding protein [Candidatus Sericytochromatia bacterium]|nr:ATP-binding protein [Candidatus Sericytochromatia bacterium]